MESWQHSAETLKWYFRAVCHGEVPLNMDWNKEAQQVVPIDPQAQAFLITLKRDLEQRRKHRPFQESCSVV